MNDTMKSRTATTPLIVFAILGLMAIMAVAWFVAPGSAHGGECDSCGQVKQKVQSTLPGTSIGEVRQTPMKGVYEIQMGKTVAYTNKDGGMFLLGHMYNPAGNIDLTAARLAELNRVEWKDLPLNDAIVFGPEDGLKVAIFTDPECPWCQKLEGILKNMKGIRTYTFLFPIESLHPQSKAKSDAIWCATDRHKALQDVMLNGENLTSAGCDTPVGRNIQLGQKLGVNGTPALINESGGIMSGAPKSDADLIAWLKQK